MTFNELLDLQHELINAIVVLAAADNGPLLSDALAALNVVREATLEQYNRVVIIDPF